MQRHQRRRHECRRGTLKRAPHLGGFLLNGRPLVVFPEKTVSRITCGSNRAGTRQYYKPAIEPKFHAAEIERVCWNRKIACTWSTFAGEGWLENSPGHKIHNDHLRVVGSVRPFDDIVVPCKIRHSTLRLVRPTSGLDGLKDNRACRLFFRSEGLQRGWLPFEDVRHRIILELGHNRCLLL